MIKTFIRYLTADLKTIAGSKTLLQILLAPLIIVLFLRILFPVVSDPTISENGFQLVRYYTLAVMTFVSLVPVIIGIFSGRLLTDGYIDSGKIDLNRNSSFWESLSMRLAESILISLILVLLIIFATNPVDSEGWLRILYVGILLSVQSAHIVLFVVLLRMGRENLTVVYCIAAFFLLAIPLGLLLESPWNIIAFLSPLYWINWAWVSPSLAESIICGMFSVVIISGPVILLALLRLKANRR